MIDPHSLVTAAIAAAGPTQRVDRRYRAKVRRLAIELYDGILADEQRGPMKSALELVDDDTKAFDTHYGGYDLEESSQRLVVRFVHADGSPVMTTGKKPEQETVRTERLDDWDGMGEYQRDQLDQLEIGQRIFVRLVHDVAGDSMKVRRLLSVRPIGPKPSASNAAPARPARPTSPPPAAADEPPDDPEKVGSRDVHAWLRQARTKLGERRYHKFASIAGQRGIDIPNVTMSEVNGELRALAAEIFTTLNEHGLPHGEEPF